MAMVNNQMVDVILIIIGNTQFEISLKKKIGPLPPYDSKKDHGQLYSHLG